MNRFFYFILLCFISITTVQAQKSSLTVDLGYRNKSDRANWGIGTQFKYTLVKDFRLGADAMIYIPEDSYMGLDIGVNAQYLIHLQERLLVYPVAGLIISNHRFPSDPKARHVTGLGFSFGLGGEFYLSQKYFINADLRYSLIDKDKPHWYKDYALFRVGLGFRL
ncbi:outer membrane beta-barrel protein [Dysgonomonas macrotermitis]|uniref:Outer membrane protein beta-barrel domain-containing protein n=1 Tax=Dysgonomonas macrotermitis TaxID=1346286 RepID=A0A1M5C9J6_9BACT|nr:outer membrane beta-barrel protein [Dysgonomonas macrotermitis]SHF51395.1 Outer membrane protein beta-barrel domain-containing protein [Dysgonomonas macrotermitis]